MATKPGSVSVGKDNTKILRCNCNHKFQDEKYGAQMRVHNFAAKDKNWRCTVCGATRG